MSIFSKQFLVDAAERLVKTFLQAFLPLFVITDLSTLETAGIAGAAAALSALSSIVSSASDAPGAALVSAEPGEENGRVPLPDEDPDIAAWLEGVDFSGDEVPDGGKPDTLTGDGMLR